MVQRAKPPADGTYTLPGGAVEAACREVRAQVVGAAGGDDPRALAEAMAGRSFTATLVVLVTIVMTVMLIRTLGMASAGRVNPSEVMLVMGFTVLGHLPTILTLSLFVAVTSTLTRMYASSEMVVWFACGQSLRDFIVPLLRFAWPVLLTVALLALFAWPWSHTQIRELRDRYQKRGDIERVAPGLFIESAGGQRVFFIDKDRAAADTGTNIFIATQEKQRETLVSARSGYIDSDANGRTLVLKDGYRQETLTDTGSMRVSVFDEYKSQIQGSTDEALTPHQSPRMLSSAALLGNPTPRHMAEMSWRVGLLLAAFNCVLIALAVTRVNPRVGRSAGMVFSLFAFASYYNLISVGQSWIERQRIGALGWLLLLHGSIAVAALGWMLWRERNWRGIEASPAVADAQEPAT